MKKMRLDDIIIPDVFAANTPNNYKLEDIAHIQYLKKKAQKKLRLKYLILLKKDGDAKIWH